MATNDEKSIPAIQRKASVMKRRGSAVVDKDEFQQRIGSQQTTEDLTWQDDALVKACKLCKANFTLTNRKHHCRQCGGVFCGKCSSYQLVIGGDLKRGCLTCYKKAVNMKESPNLGLKQSYQPFSYTEQISSPMNIKSKAGSESSGITSRESMSESSSVNDKCDDLPPWAEALIYVSKADDRPTETFQFPKESFSEQFTSDIACNAIPPSLHNSAGQDVSFLFRIKQKVSSNNISDDCDVLSEDDSEDDYNMEYFYCYVSYRQRSLSSAKGNTIHRHAVVLISKWSYPQLAFGLLSKLEEGLFWQCLKLITVPELVNVASNMMMVAFGQVMLWPVPNADSSMYLPFLGEMLQYYVIPDVWQAFYGGITLLPTQWPSNLIALLGPLGLLQHMWTIWEMLVTGQDIIVYSTSPSQCSEFVIALATAMAPLHFIGELRPCISVHDSDFPTIRQLIMKNQSSKASLRQQNQSSRDIRKMTCIIGTTEAQVVAALDVCNVAIFLNSPATATADIDTVYLGMRKRHIAGFRLLSSEGKVENPLSSVLSEWLQKGKEQSLIVSSSESSAYNDMIMIRKIKHMQARERLILGEKLIRDNLRTLTLSYLKPSDVDDTAESYDIKAAEGYKKKIIELKVAQHKKRSARPKETGILGYLDELALMLRTSPEIIMNNIPSFIMWIGYAVISMIYSLIGLPVVALVAVVFLVKIPVFIPADIEEIMKVYIPEHILYPMKPPSSSSESTPASDHVSSTSSISSSSSKASTSSSSQAAGPVDFSGTWKRIKCINYENFLAVQGIGYVQRRLAANINMMHTITMDADLTAFRLQEKAGPIDSDNLYEINDTITKSTLLGKKEFVDKVYWDEHHVLTIHKIHVPEKDYEIIVKRYHEDQGKTIRLVAIWKDLKSSTVKPVETTCYFEKTGPSPNDLPASHKKASTSTSSSLSSPRPSVKISSTVSTKKRYTNFSGVWQRVKAVNFEEFVGVQGAGFLQRKIAASMPLTHTIMMDVALKAMRLKEAGGPLEVDNSFTIGNNFILTKILKKEFKEKVFWMGCEAIVCHRVANDDSYEMVMTRRLYDDGNQIILTSVHRDLRTMKEVEATSWFNKVGNATLPAPVALPLPANAIVDMEDENQDIISDDEDDDADDDAQALLKQRVKSSANATRQTSIFVGTADVQSYIHDDINPIIELNKEYIGTWERTQTVNVDALIKADAALGNSLRVLHTIDFPASTSVHIHEVIGSQSIIDMVFNVGDDFISHDDIHGKNYMERVYVEGQVLVHHRLHQQQDHEYLYKRYMEDSGNTMRLVTIHRNLTTGTDTESMALFTRKKD